MKKIAIVISIFLLLVSATACNNDSEPQEQSVTTTVLSTISPSDNQDQPTEINTNISHSTQIYEETKTNADNVSSWTKSDIVEAYKNAASKSTANITSVQNIALNDIVINDGTGMANSVISIVKPIISKVVSGNSTEFDGITGGYSDLCEADVKTASVSMSGENTVIKLEMNEQTDSGEMSEKSGSVGHAISVIGDLSTVMSQLSDSGLPVEIDNKNVSATYVNPKVNITIDKDGNIINGTWSYTVTITLKNFKVAGSTVNKTAVTIGNVITYNGGFNG